MDEILQMYENASDEELADAEIYSITPEDILKMYENTSEKDLIDKLFKVKQSSKKRNAKKIAQLSNWLKYRH